GREFSGVSESTGEPVMGYTQFGAFAEFVAIAPGLWWPRPSAWSAEEAAAFPVNYFTAWLAYWTAGLTGATSASGSGQPTRSSARVLIPAAAGGVGTAAVPIGNALGVAMCGSSSSTAMTDVVGMHRVMHACTYIAV